MAATMASMSILNAKCLNINKTAAPKLALPKSISLSTQKPSELSISTATTSAVAATIFATLTTTDAAYAAQQIADLAEGDNRGLALLLPIIPALGWVLFNILQPALNQLNKMRNERAVVVGLGIGSGLAAAGFMAPDMVSAAELGAIADLAEASSSDSRGLLLLGVVAPALGWVLFNILQPALNQFNKMRSDS